MQYESAIGAVPSAADTCTDINTFTVPTGVKRMKNVRIAVIGAQEAEEVRNARLKAQDAKAAAYKGFIQQESV